MARQISTSPDFDRDLKRIAKKERSIQTAVDLALKEIASCQQPTDDVIPGCQSTHVYKRRVRFGNRGASGGARLIYYCAEHLVLALFLYLKSEMSNVAPHVVLEALKAASLIPEQTPEKKRN